LFQQFLNLPSSQRDMSGPILGDLSNNRWPGGSTNAVSWFANSFFVFTSSLGYQVSTIFRSKFIFHYWYIGSPRLHFSTLEVGIRESNLFLAALNQCQTIHRVVGSRLSKYINKNTHNYPKLREKGFVVQKQRLENTFNVSPPSTQSFHAIQLQRWEC
jgi:hypothetical protein